MEGAKDTILALLKIFDGIQLKKCKEETLKFEQQLFPVTELFKL